MNQKKNNTRNYAKSIRSMLDVEACSRDICSQILLWEKYRAARHVMLFYPVGTEISLLQLVKDKTKSFYFPILDENNNIYPVLYEENSGFKKGAFNINEPIGVPVRDFSVLAMLFIPALAIDTRGFRLGYGKGCYDKFICHLTDKTLKVVPISKSLIFNDIPVEQHDKKVDYAICENGITGFATHLLNG